MLVWRRHHPGLKTRCPPHPPGVLVRGEDAGRPEEEVTRRPRQRRTACPRVRDTRGGGSRREPGERREMAALWPSAGRATLRDGPPRPASGLPSRGRERFRRLEPPRCGSLSRQPHDLQAGCQGGAGPGCWMSRGRGGGRLAESPTGALAVAIPVGVRKGHRGNRWEEIERGRRSSVALAETAGPSPPLPPRPAQALPRVPRRPGAAPPGRVCLQGRLREAGGDSGPPARLCGVCLPLSLLLPRGGLVPGQRWPAVAGQGLVPAGGVFRRKLS